MGGKHPTSSFTTESKAISFSPHTWTKGGFHDEGYISGGRMPYLLFHDQVHVFKFLPSTF